MTYTAKNSAGALPDLTAIITVKVNNAQGPYFKANGVTNLTAKVGDTIHYSWISTGSAFSSSYTTDKADTCSGGSAGPGIKYPWVANTVAGSTDAVVQACQAGVTYYINYLATCAGCGTISQDITVKVNP